MSENMNNQWKMVPDTATAQMEDAGCQAYMDAEGMIGIMHKSSMGHAFQAMLAAAPVPPAGDVEVQPLQLLKRVIASGVLAFEGEAPQDLELLEADICAAIKAAPSDLLNHCHLQRAKLAEAEVTRLTAERDGLLVEVGQWRASNKANALAAGELVASLQSELTKARELQAKTASMLLDWQTWLGANRESCDERGKLLWDRITALTTHQSAPAAKGEQ